MLLLHAQELPEGAVPLKSAGSETSAVSNDARQYGIAAELGGADAPAHLQGVDPFGVPLAAAATVGVAAALALPGMALPAAGADEGATTAHKYVYDEDAGQLVTSGNGMAGGGGWAAEFTARALPVRAGWGIAVQLSSCS